MKSIGDDLVSIDVDTNPRDVPTYPSYRVVKPGRWT